MYAAHLMRVSSSPAEAGASQKQSGTISSSLPRWKATAANGRFEMNFSNRDDERSFQIEESEELWSTVAAPSSPPDDRQKQAPSISAFRQEELDYLKLMDQCHQEARDRNPDICLELKPTGTLDQSPVDSQKQAPSISAFRQEELEYLKLMDQCIQEARDRNPDDRQNSWELNSLDGLGDDDQVASPMNELDIVDPSISSTGFFPSELYSPIGRGVANISPAADSPMPISSVYRFYVGSPMGQSMKFNQKYISPCAHQGSPSTNSGPPISDSPMPSPNPAQATMPNQALPMLPTQATPSPEPFLRPKTRSTSQTIKERNVETTISSNVIPDTTSTATDTSKAGEFLDVDASAADLEKHRIIFRHLNLQTARKLDNTGGQTHLSVQKGTAKSIIAMASPFLEPGDTVLDAGCGYAEALMHFSVVRPDLKYVGFEVDANRVLGYLSRVQKLQEELEPLGMQCDNIVVCHQDLHDVPLLVDVKLLYMYEQAFDECLDEHMWTLAEASLCCEFVLCMKPTKAGYSQSARTRWIIDNVFTEVDSCSGMSSGGGESGTWRLYRKKEEFLDSGREMVRNTRYFDSLRVTKHRDRPLQLYEALLNRDYFRHANGKNGTPEKAEISQYLQTWGQKVHSPLSKRSFAAIEESASNELAKVDNIMSRKRESKKRRSLSDQCLGLNADAMCIDQCDVCANVFGHCKLSSLEGKESSIHKKGLFTKETLPEGKFVIEYTGEKTKSTKKKSSPYVLQLSGTYIKGSGKCRFINHSCDPNCELRKWKFGEYNERVSLVTLREIPAGTELTACYQDFDPCLCGKC
jgi:hypothetical protein